MLLDSGALTPRFEPTDLIDAVASAVHDLRGEIGARKLVLDVPPSLPLVDADARLLHHILINLIGNAAVYSPEASSITISGARDPQGLSLSVIDEGRGLPPGDTSVLFDRFARVEGTDRKGGTGLGLAIVKGFADVMGLSVDAANRDGAGAVFSLRWPDHLVRRSPAAGSGT